jgi:hypothetical protein
MPAHVRFLLRNALIGFALAVAMVGAMVWFDFAGLRTLAAQSNSGLVAFPVLAFFLGLTFASVQMGAAIMLMPADGDGGNGGNGGNRSRVTSLLALLVGPVPVLQPAKGKAGCR